MKLVWTEEQIERAKEILSRHSEFTEALDEICRTVRLSSPGSLRNAFLVRKIGPPTSFLRVRLQGGYSPPPSPPPPPPSSRPSPPPMREPLYETRPQAYETKPPVYDRVENPSRVEVGTTASGFATRQAPESGPGVAKALDPDVKRLNEIARRGPVPFEELCDRFDLSPSKMRALIERAQALGVKLDIAHDHIGVEPNQEDRRIQDVGIAPVVGGRQMIGVISDLHYGSKYVLRKQLIDFVEHAYGQGVREIVVPGDLTEGIYRHALWHCSHMGLEDQVTDMVESLPQLPGLTYRAITGNHDETHEEGCGVLFGPYTEGRFAQAGRNDIKFYGRRAAYLRIGGAVIHLWHPRGNGAYARSYKLQKKIEAYESGMKPHILLCGHYHQYIHLYERGVHAFLCPTFKGGEGVDPFGNSLIGSQSIGGMLISWEMTRDGTMRELDHKYRAYFEVEKVYDVSAEARLQGAVHPNHHR